MDFRVLLVGMEFEKDLEDSYNFVSFELFSPQASTWQELKIINLLKSSSKLDECATE